MSLSSPQGKWGRSGWMEACHVMPPRDKTHAGQTCEIANMAARPTTSRRRVGDSGKDTAAIEVLHRKDENLRSGVPSLSSNPEF